MGNMTRYAVEPDAASPTCKSRGSHLRVHFKHCREITHHIKGMNVKKALKLWMMSWPSKQFKSPGNNGRWPVKATALVKDLLSNAISNGETKGLDPENLYISHAQCNRAPPGRRRTYRAHGRIGKYASQP